MSEFKCEVVQLKIEPHPQADQIEIAKVGDFQSIVKKGEFQDGDLAVYIPEQAVLPQWLLEEMGFWDETRGKGKLSGSAGNRVKAIKLRGVLSQGIIYPLGWDKIDHFGNGDLILKNPEKLHHPDRCFYYYNDTYMWVVFAGDDLAELLGITKYEPPLPSHMAGRAIGVDFGATHKYDFDNIKKMPDLFEDGEPVVMTEKIHGTFMCVGVVPTQDSNEKYYQDRVIVTSKGMGARGIVLDHNDETNLYAQAAKKHDLLNKVLEHLGPLSNYTGKPVFLLGEVFGRTMTGANVQDLIYDGEQLGYRAFDICIGNRGSETYYPWSTFRNIPKSMNIPIVPLIYSGPYSKQAVLECTDGLTILGNHIREGVVVKSRDEVGHPRYGRKIAKSISEAYLLRKGAATEFS